MLEFFLVSADGIFPMFLNISLSSTSFCILYVFNISLPINKLQEGLVFEHYPGKELDSIVSLEEAHQPSPVSVLEPHFKEETLSISESSGINSRGELAFDNTLTFKFMPSKKLCPSSSNLFWL